MESIDLWHISLKMDKSEQLSLKWMESTDLAEYHVCMSSSWKSKHRQRLSQFHYFFLRRTVKLVFVATTSSMISSPPRILLTASSYRSRTDVDLAFHGV